MYVLTAKPVYSCLCGCSEWAGCGELAWCQNPPSWAFLFL